MDSPLSEQPFSLRLEDGRQLPVVAFEGTEALMELYRFEVTFATAPDAGIADGLLGREVVLSFVSEGGRRLVHGIVARLEEGESDGRTTHHHASMVPRAWLLQHRFDCRIFQDEAVPAILRRVFEAAGLPAESYRFALERPHEALSYCVQYRESDWAFASRLMEKEGLYCFFDHSDDGHVLVVADGAGVHEPLAEGDHVPFRDPSALTSGEAVTSFRLAREVRPGKVTLRDYNFAKPSLDLEVRAGDAALEVYDHPGDHALPDAGRSAAALRLEGLAWPGALARGASTRRALVPGRVFVLDSHPIASHNRAFLLVHVAHRGDSRSGSDGRPRYENTFTAVPSDLPYRAPLRTPRPTIKGVQSAVVVGPPGEEIHTDEHGRVKVRFFWDRRAEQTSCWIRVSQIWAGAGWGGMIIPRVGHEVIVDFYDGDPDRPLVVGRVYHGANVPPYPLPEHASKSTLRSNSTPGGEGWNELRFEDKKGDEEVYFRAEKDMNVDVLHDQSTLVGHDQRVTVEHDRTKSVGNDQSETVGANKSIRVGGSHGESIGGSKTLSVGGSRSKSIAGDQTETIGGGKQTKVEGSFLEDIGGGATISINLDKTEGVGGKSAQSVGADKTVVVSGNYGIETKGERSARTDKDDTELVRGSKVLRVDETILIKCGDSEITMNKAGAVTITARQITVRASQDVRVESEGNVIIDSAKTVEVKGSSQIKLQGGRVGIN